MKTFAICIGLAIVGLSGMSACSEKAGEKADSAIENATQGHKNLGEGFWIALERLEPYL